MTYLLEITRGCGCDPPAPLAMVSGNAFDPGTFKAACQKCGSNANIYSAQEVGLDPSSPDFQRRVDVLLEGFTALTYYVVMVTDGKMTMEPRARTQVSVEFHTIAECNTCHKKISGDVCSQKELNDFITEHKSHDLSTNTFINSTDPRVLKMAEEAMRNQQKSRGG
jgi:hypothetical protein